MQAPADPGRSQRGVAEHASPFSSRADYGHYTREEEASCQRVS
jgi:hypothetical protein